MSSHFPTLAWNGEELLAAWPELFGTMGARIARGAEPVGVGPLLRGVNQPSIALTPEGYGLASTINGSPNREIAVSLLDAEANVEQADLVVGAADGMADRPSLVWDGDELAVAWEDDTPTPGTSAIFFARGPMRCAE